MKIEPIAYIETPFREKFGTPRQSGLIHAVKGEIHFVAPYNRPEMVLGLEQFSHLWLLFQFHKTAAQGWKSTVRPPRLGGNQKLGVFATRSNFRPNPIGLSVVTLESIQHEKNHTVLHVSGMDLIDNTPIIDIKPYLPYADSIPEARAGFAQTKPEAVLTVIFTPEIETQLTSQCDLRQLIIDVIQYDPRPAYQKQQKRVQPYGVTLDRWNVEFEVNEQIATVFAITECAIDSD